MSNKRTMLFILCLLVIAVLLGFNYVYQPFLTDQNQDLVVAVSPTPNPGGDPQAGSFDLSQVTPRQKIAGLLAVPLTLTEGEPLPASASAWITDNQPGVVTLFGTRLSAQYVSTQIQTLKQTVTPQFMDKNLASSFKPLIAVDHEGGAVQRLSGEGFTILPSWQSLCAQPATTSAQLLQTSALEVQEAGIDLVLAPMTDVARSHPVLKNRVCSGDATEVIRMSGTYIEAMAAVGVQSVVKHFPGIGQTTRDLHTGFDRVTITAEDAKLYQALLTKYPTVGVMVSHAGVTNQYPDIPCSLSRDCVGQVSSNFPEVLIVSDALEMKSASFQPDSKTRSLPEVAEAAVRAGEQVLVFGPQTTWVQLSEVMTHLEKTYTEDELFQAQVDRAFIRLKQVVTR